MATLYQRPGSNNWFMKFQHNGKVYRKSTGETSKTDAKKAMKRKLAKLKGESSIGSILEHLNSAILGLPKGEQNKARHEAAQQILSNLSSKVKIAEAWDIWLRNPKKRNPGPKTLSSYTSRWNAFTKWIEKDHDTIKYLHEVTASMSEEYASQLWAKGISPATYNAHMNFLKGMFKVLETRAGLLRNVWMDLPSMELETEGRRELKPKELAKICKKATGNMRYLFAVGLYTGMRLGDVCMLKWAEVDLKNEMIEHMPMKTKRKNKIIRLPLHPVLSAMLKELKKKGEYLFPDYAELYQKDSSAISKRIQKYFEDNGIKTTEEAAGEHRKNAIVRVGFHSLRHSFVSLCAANNVPQVAIMELVGHGSPAMTRLYSHAGSEQKAKAVAALPDIAFKK